jgi:hypothetical protein
MVSDLAGMNLPVSFPSVVPTVGAHHNRAVTGKYPPLLVFSAGAARKNALTL